MSFELIAKYGPWLLQGLAVTIIIVGVSLMIGAILALPIAMGRISSNKVWATLSYCYVYFFRGTPLLAQTFLVYYGAGQFYQQLQAYHLWWFFSDAYYCVILTFSLNTAAYQAEILRGSILAIPKGQIEAAAACGLKRNTIMRKVILPQALILALRPYGNEVILMIKGSAIASIITIYDLMGATKLAYGRTFDFSIYLWAAILYLVLVEIIRRLWNRAETRLTRHVVVRSYD